MKAAIQIVGLVFLFAVDSFAQPAMTNGAPLRALILTGGEDQNWRDKSEFLRGLLLDCGRFDVRVSETAGIAAKAVSAFDLVVLDCSGSSLDSESANILEKFVHSGRGLLVTRAGFEFLTKRNEPGNATVAKFLRLIQASADPKETTDSAPSFHRFEINNALREHPVMAGVKIHLPTADQPLDGFLPGKGAEVLATGDRNEPLLFTSISGKGRVFCTALGHDLGAIQEKAFITTFLRGAEWAASGRVTLPEEIGMPEPGTNGVRTLVITGGHDHEASFYTLFNGWKDLGWVPVTDSKLAFQQDLRAKYDVLILYDFARDLEEKGKKNLRDFIESGKGVVVLHHGILDFQKWPWWYEEVVGGLYRLERQGNIPNSTVKFGEEHWITPAGDHPITRAIAPFHLMDETYKGLFISPKVTPLLLTDNPTSDRVVAWVGPCNTSKVVFIQLGHDHSPFRHPSYRALVHNSILWTGGRLN